MSTDSPLVSIIIPTYNWSSVLRYAIESVRWQTYPHWELLVIGDGCTDDSAEVVASFGDARIRWHNLPANTGNQSAPNNKALEMAQGSLIAYLGHDDLWYPTHLAVLVDTMRDPRIDVAYTMVAIVGAGEDGPRLINSPENIIGIPPPSLMHRRTLIDEIGGWRDYREINTYPDRDFKLRALGSGKHFEQVYELTLFKFPAGWRKNVYQEKPFADQAHYAQRMINEPDFLYRETLKYLRNHTSGRCTPVTAPRKLNISQRYQREIQKEMRPP